MNKPGIYIMLIFVCSFYKCNRNEAIMLSGDIVGNIRMIDENYYSVSDKSGVLVSLEDDTAAYNTTSDESGLFTFENIIVGNYLIDLEKEGFIKSYPETFDYYVHHIGGYSPTIVGYTMNEVPGFQLVTDSVVYSTGSSLGIFGKISGNERNPRIGGYHIRCFFSNLPSVSMDNFISVTAGWITVSEEDSTRISGFINKPYNLDSSSGDTVYMCAYPQAYGQSLYEFYNESLGNPSNVVGFVFK